MKSSFLLFLILGGLLTTSVFAQTKTKKTVTTKTVTTTTTTTVPAAEVQKSAFDKFYERLSIGYFGAAASPPLKKWNSKFAAISPEFSTPCKNCDTYSANLWSQINFAYNFGARMKFNVLPRWTTFFATPKTNGANDDGQGTGERGMFLLEDALVGFSGVIYSSDDKKFNWWMRPGVRLPTSHFSKHYDHPDFGRLTYQLEVTNSFTYDFNPKFQMGLTFQDRYWIFENRYNHSRNRLYFAPNITYTINDTTKFIAYYENMLENNKRWESINGKKPMYQDVWQNAYVGIGKDITSRLNVYPYLSAFVNDVPFTTRSFWLGAWISYTIK